MITSTQVKLDSIYVSNTVNNFFAKCNTYPFDILSWYPHLFLRDPHLFS